MRRTVWPRCATVGTPDDNSLICSCLRKPVATVCERRLTACTCSGNARLWPTRACTASALVRVALSGGHRLRILSALTNRRALHGEPAEVAAMAEQTKATKDTPR